MARYTPATIPAGITPHYMHNRHPKTGRIESTLCVLRRDDSPVACGLAVSSEKEKSPSKKTGRLVSLGRALKQLDKGEGYE